MTKNLFLLAALVALPAAFAQSPPPTPNENLQRIIAKATGAPETPLTKFTLDFPGGSPKQLVGAIEKAMGKPLNAIIPPEHADVKLPPLKMNNIDVQQLFQALELTSKKTESYSTGTTYMGGMRQVASYQQMVTYYGFRTQGQLSDQSIWYFYVEKPAPPPPAQTQNPPKVCRYFALAPYLDRGQSVDDITTAIQTGWKMLGEEDVPKISFHKETKLLIAVGDPGRLETIDAVLEALKRSSVPKNIDPATGLPFPPDGPAPSPKPK